MPSTTARRQLAGLTYNALFTAAGRQGDEAHVSQEQIGGGGDFSRVAKKDGGDKATSGASIGEERYI